MDDNLVLRDGSTNLTANVTLTSTLIGPMVKPLWLHIVVPQIGEVNDLLDVELEFCAASASTTEVNNKNLKQIIAAGHYSIPFFTRQEYLQVKLACTDADVGGDLNFGAVKVWVDTAGRYTDKSD